jgi:hypothetical protein
MKKMYINYKPVSQFSMLRQGLMWRIKGKKDGVYLDIHGSVDDPCIMIIDNHDHIVAVAKFSPKYLEKN